MRLEGNKLYYREITVEDTDMLLKWRNGQYVRDHFIHRDLITREEHLEWLEKQVKTGKVIQYIMIEKDGDHPVGSVYLRDVDYIKKTAEYGIFIGNEQDSGKGYGTEAAHVMISYVFQKLQFDCLTLRVLADNLRAIKSYEKAGFAQDVEREGYVEINGREELVLFMKICKEQVPNE